MLGYLFLRLNLDPAPLMLGLILGPLPEENLRRALLLSRGKFSVFATQPISGTLVAIPKAGAPPHLGATCTAGGRAVIV